MAKQNIYDNETFFDGYRELRYREVNANTLFEIPTLISLLPDLEGKRVLDLGCGMGEHCVDYVNRGASRVVGVDISKKMLEVARKENSDPKITYLNIPMEDIGSIDERFDVVISSLAIHYIEDFKGVKVCRMSYGTWGNEVMKCHHPRGYDYWWMVGRYTNDEPEAEDTDRWALDHGYVAITPTQIDLIDSWFTGPLS